MKAVSATNVNALPKCRIELIQLCSVNLYLTSHFLKYNRVEKKLGLRIILKNRLQQNDSYDLECNIAPKESLWGRQSRFSRQLGK